MGSVARRSAWLVIMVAAGCGLVEATPTPSPPAMSFEILVDVGIFAGPPDPPPPYAVTQLTDETVLVFADRGAVQLLREVRWNGQRWESLAGLDASLIPAAPDGPYLRAASVGSADGFSVDAVVLVGRIPNGPINRLELEVDGAPAEVWVDQRPAFLAIFPGGTELGGSFTAFDAGTHELAAGPVHRE